MTRRPSRSHLRSGLTWSDGDPITADEIVWSVNEIYKNEEVETSTRDALVVGGEFAEFELIDDLTYRIVLPSVYACWADIASIGPMPRHIFEPLIQAEGAAAVNSFWGVDTDVSTIVGNGPFLISEHVPSQRVVMTPNPHYYEKDEWGQQLPYLDEFVIEFVEDQDTMPGPLHRRRNRRDGHCAARTTASWSTGRSPTTS